MKFYFCEKCGKRVTDDDLNAGAAIDKQTKGVFCKACGIGITTGGFDPVPEVQAQEVKHDQPAEDVPGSSANLTGSKRRRRRTTAHNTRISRSKITAAVRRPRQSSSGLPAARQTSGVHKVPPVSDTPAAPNRSSSRLNRSPRDSPTTPNSIFAMGILAGLFVMLGAALLLRGSGTTAQKRGATEAGTSQVTKLAPPPAPTPRPERPSKRESEPAIEPEVRRVPEIQIEGPGPKQPEDTPETRARTAYDALLRFEGLAEDDLAGRTRHIKVFLAQHGETVIAAQARVLLEKLEKELKQNEPPKPKGRDEESPSSAVDEAGEESTPDKSANLKERQAALAQEKNRSAWAEIEKLFDAKKFAAFIKQAEAFRNQPPGGPLSVPLSGEVTSGLAGARAAVQVQTLGLKAPIRALPGGKLELIYDFKHSKQLMDFRTTPSPKVYLSGAELRLRGTSVRNVLPFEGDLSVAYEIAAPAPSPNRIHLHFFDYRCEFGGSDNKWTALWRSGDSYKEPIAKKDGFKIERGKWHQVKIDYTAVDKRTRLTIDGRHVLAFTDPQAKGSGYVYLGAQVPVKIRNLQLRGKPCLKLIVEAKRRREQLNAFMKKLTSGRIVRIFTKDDKP